MTNTKQNLELPSVKLCTKMQVKFGPCEKLWKKVLKFMCVETILQWYCESTMKRSAKCKIFWQWLHNYNALCICQWCTKIYLQSNNGTCVPVDVNCDCGWRHEFEKCSELNCCVLHSYGTKIRWKSSMYMYMQTKHMLSWLVLHGREHESMAWKCFW